jgi:lysophospholipase L1-like esterase
MTAHIQAEAAKRGFAYFALGTLYDRNDIKGPFSASALLGTATPYGDYFSLDGLHPSALGQTILARAAAQALNDTYSLGIPLP